jgi:hypothetical protein
MGDSGEPVSSDQTFLSVLALAIAALFQLIVTSGPFNLWHVMSGSIILLILASYRITPALRVSEILALSAAWGLTTLITGGWALQWLFPNIPRLENGELPGYFVFWWWVLFSSVAAVVVFRRRRMLRLGERRIPYEK